MKFHHSINNESNPVGNTAEFFIVHHTGSLAPDVNQRNHLNRDDFISCHFGIERSGKIFLLMDLDRIAYHCGVSEWHGNEAKDLPVFNPKTGKKFFLSGMNPVSLGVEVYSDGKSFTKSQVKACIQLLAWWCIQYDRPVENILRHADIAPRRKWDIGENFFVPEFGSWEGFQKAVQDRIDIVQRHFSGVSKYTRIRYT